MNKSITSMVMIRGGAFTMGSEIGNSNEQPPHTIEVNSFLLDVHVVTNTQYRQFLEENPEWKKENIDAARADKDYLNLWTGLDYPPYLANHAVINVSWYAATAYAAWAGKRLPTEAEWEYAAGGTEHFVWSLGNVFESKNYWFGVETDPVGYPILQRPKNSFGLFDMSGGIWEWVQDAYDVDFFQRSPKNNPINLRDAPRKTLKGGSAHFDLPAYLRCSVRGSNEPTACHEDYGFRCAKDIE